MPVAVTAAASAPPVKAARARPVKAAEDTTAITAARAQAINELSAIPTAACLAAGQLADAGTIQLYWPRFSAELAKLANTLAPVAAVADRLMTVSPYTGIAQVGMMMALQFAVNHKMVPAGTAGTQSPESIAAQLQAQIARAELDSLREQMEAERESREFKAELDKLNTEMTATNAA